LAGFSARGAHLERADNVFADFAGALPAVPGQEPVARGIERTGRRALLKSCSAFEAFRKNHHSALEPAASPLFCSSIPRFPRSLRYSVGRLFEASGDQCQNPGVSLEPLRQAGWLNAQLTYMRGAEQITEREDPSLEMLLGALAQISEATASAYFKNEPTVRPQVQSQWQQGFGQGQSQSQRQKN
jgi:uncharacterized alpha-E superfamily protein